MKKKWFLLLVTASVLTLGACGGHSSSNDSYDESSEEPVSSETRGSSAPTSSSEDKGILGAYYRLSYDSILMKDENNNKITIAYNIPDAYFSFDHASTTFKKELAIASMAFVANAPYKNKIAETYTHFGFDNLVYSDEFTKEETEDTILYTIGHKKVGSYDLVNLSLSGHNYTKPWASNFLIGKTGNHQGFQTGADKVMTALNAYLANYNKDSLKFYINGYSRSAGIAEIIATSLIDNNKVNEDCLYGYLFETPRGIDMSNTKEYKSIFNIINSRDVVTYVAPEEYGLKRAGVDVDINKDNADELLVAFNSKLVMPNFYAAQDETTSFSNDVEFINYMFSYLLEPLEEEGSFDISTREHYVDGVQAIISPLVALAFSLDEKTLNDIKEAFSALDTWSMIGLITEDGLYNFLKPILDANEVVYDNEMLRTNTNALITFATQKYMILMWAMSDDVKGNVFRVVYYHCLEAILPLLINL